MKSIDELIDFSSYNPVVSLLTDFVDGRLGRGDGLGQHEHGGEVGVVPLSCVLDALLSLLSLAGTPSVFTYIDLLTLHINY